MTATPFYYPWIFTGSIVIRGAKNETKYWVGKEIIT